jgi:hypothetical protein
MTKGFIVIGVIAALLLPATAAAKPNRAERQAAKAECKAERGKTRDTRKAFKAKYHSFRACVRQKAAEEEAENDKAHKNAAKECRAERSEDPAAFREKYGTNENKKNAFGKCVSQKASEKKAALDAEDEEDAEDAEDEEDADESKNAAQECAAERDQDPAAFQEKYGENKNGKNAFGKCVSSKT